MKPARYAVVAVVLLGACGKGAPPPRRRSPAPPPAPPQPIAAPAAPDVSAPAPAAKAPPPKAEQSPTGFKFGARDRARAYLPASEPADWAGFDRLLKARNLDALLEKVPATFHWGLIRALDDDEAVARFCLEFAVQASEKMNLIDTETGKVMPFKWDKFNDAGYRSGWVATYIGNLRGTGILQGE